MKTQYISSFLSFLLLCVGSTLYAQTSLPQGKQGKLAKAYQNLTAKYNGYFNAKVILNEEIDNLSNSYQDNYNQILKLYKYTEVEDVKTSSAELDRAIIKAAVDIKLHPTSVFKDDCYLLIGKSQYLKRNFADAENTFAYIISELDPDKVKKTSADRKAVNKEREKDKKVVQKQKAKAKKEKEKERKDVSKERAKSRADIKKEREKAAKARAKERAKERKNKNKARTSPKPKPKPTDPVKKIETPKETPKTENTEKAKEEAKKVEEEIRSKPESYFLKHRPIHKDAMLWLARTYVEQGKYPEAKSWMAKIEDEGGLIKQTQADLQMLSAYMFLRRKQYNEAVPFLDKAVELGTNKQERIRAAYILAQIHQAEGRRTDAKVAFERVLKLKPSYDMEFSARLQMITNSIDDGTDSKSIEKELKRMLKDEKNFEYKDQIYFALARISIQEGDEDQAIKYLQNSAYFSVKNTAQKSESYLMLANLFYKQDEFVDAKLYYDSTLTVLDSRDERYTSVEKKRASLEDIATNLQTIELQDSFLRIFALIDGKKEKEYMIIAQAILEQQKKEKEAKLAPSPASRFGQPQRPTANSQGFGRTPAAAQQAGGAAAIKAHWSYDENKVRKTKREFVKIWGERKLADDWRRSNKRTQGGDLEVGDFSEEQEIFDLTQEEALALFKKMGVPQDNKQKESADNAIIEAMSALGTLFRDRIKREDKSIEILETLMKRYPDNKYKLESMYALYILYKEAGNTSKTNYYKDRILKEGKGTKFAKVISDPSYATAASSKEENIEKHYNAAYKLFEQGKYKEARAMIDEVPKKFGKEIKIQAKFDLLAAMCTGGIDGKEQYKIGLQEVVSKHKDTDEAKTAKQILNVIGGKGKAKTNNPNATNKSAFKTNEAERHFVIVEYNESEVKQRDAKIFVSDYNTKYHSLEKLRISNFLIDIKIPTIIIRIFKNSEEAVKYISEINNAEDFFAGRTRNYTAVAISQTNYRTLLSDRKRWEEYKAFFDNNY